MNEKSLFRQAALAHVKYKNHGCVFINTPFNYTVIAVGYSVFVICLVLFIMLAEFSEKCTVSGYLNSAQGVARIYAKQRGIIMQSLMKPGDEVKQGDVLFWVDTSYDELGTSYQSSLLRTLKKRQRALEDAIKQKKSQLELLRPLLIKKYIASSVYQVKSDEISALISKKNALKMERIRYKQSRAYPIRAPIAGVISSILYHVGQSTPIAKPLAMILPREAPLMAELYVPVSMARFLNSKKQVLIRYDAYPYQRFGSAMGQIETISRNTLTDAEEDKPLRIGQPYYKAIATLDKQAVFNGGSPCSLQQGMTLSAVLVGERKKVWQWIFDPLYSYYGELKA